MKGDPITKISAEIRSAALAKI